MCSTLRPLLPTIVITVFGDDEALLVIFELFIFEDNRKYHSLNFFVYSNFLLYSKMNNSKITSNASINARFIMAKYRNHYSRQQWAQCNVHKLPKLSQQLSASATATAAAYFQ